MFFFFILFNGDIMLLFIKGFLIGIGKIIPGVSGAMLAINFKVYERLLQALTSFFSNWKENFKFLLLLGSGIISAIILGSRVLLYLYSNYKFITMMFFVGLIIGGVYNFSNNINYNKKSITIIGVTTLICLSISILNINNNYELKNNSFDNIIFFLGGIIEVFASLVPGISGTSLLMIIGIYDNILAMVSNAFNIAYVIKNINIYLSYSIGMFISLIINLNIISYLLKEYKNITYTIILGLSTASIIFLCLICFKLEYTLIEFIIGIMLFTIGLLISTILDK